MRTIKSKKEFARVFSTGKRRNHRLVRIIVCDSNEGSEGELAFVAAKRLGNAVFRNHCKRRLRAAAHELRLPLADKSVICFATHKTHDAPISELTLALGSLLRKELGQS